MAESEMTGGGETTPRPDPTDRTTADLIREIGQLEKTINLQFVAVATELDGVRRLTAERFDAVDESFDHKSSAIREILEKAIETVAANLQGEINLTAERFTAGTGVVTANRELFAGQMDSMREMLNERYATQCVSADTPILCTDLIWRPAGDLLVGDELIGFDEEPSLNHEGGHRSVRRFRKSVVTANEIKRDSLLLVTTTLGSIRCNRDHPFLAKVDGRGWQWIRAEDLMDQALVAKQFGVRQGTGITVMYACDPWEQDRSFEGGWLSGFIDGEGCLSVGGKFNEGRARFTINQRVSPTADLMVDMFKERFPHIQMWVAKRSNPKWSPMVQLQMDRRIDIMRLLGSVRPQRLLVNADKVWENFPLRGTDRRATVTSVEAVGTGLIASLSTSTKTYIANGFAVHNTKALDAAFLAQQAAVATSFDASEKAMAAALLAAKEAVEKANVATEKRFDNVTELLAQLSATLTLLIPRAESEARMAALDARVTDIKSAVDKGFTGVDVRHDAGAESTADTRANLAIAISVGMGLLTIISMIIINAMHIAGH